MHYSGYLHRNPNDPQNVDYTGYNFWLTKLDQRLQGARLIVSRRIKAHKENRQIPARAVKLLKKSVVIA